MASILGKLYSRILQAINRRIRLVWDKIDTRISKYSVRSGVLSSIYYAFFNRSFDREHQAVLLGKLIHSTSSKEGSTTSSILRRGIHRLEKGLIMQPRRNIFALGYINQTFSFYESAIQNRQMYSMIPDEELQWAHDVLSEYFRVTSNHPKIDTLRERFYELDKVKDNIQTSQCRPYERNISVAPSVLYEDLLELANRRRSVRWFLDKPVPRNLIKKAIKVASLSPSACNRQPFEFRVFDQPDLVNKIASLPAGTKGFAHNFPAIIVVIGELRNYYGERDRHLIYIDASLAAMSFVYAAETLELSTCCINWPDIEEYEKTAEDVLHLEKDQRPIMFIAVGYPDPSGLVAYSQKKPIHQICKFN